MVAERVLHNASDDDDDDDEDGPRRGRTCVAAWSAVDPADRSQIVANAAALA